jgi:hypothetical protein
MTAMPGLTKKAEIGLFSNFIPGAEQSAQTGWAPGPISGGISKN